MILSIYTVILKLSACQVRSSVPHLNITMTKTTLTTIPRMVLTGMVIQDYVMTQPTVQLIHTEMDAIGMMTINQLAATMIVLILTRAECAARAAEATIIRTMPAHANASPTAQVLSITAK